MTATFDPTIATETDWVRFQIGDTDTNGMYLEDETIDYFINLNSKEQAVIDCIENIIAQLSAPSTKLDWLTVDYSQAREGYEKLLLRRKQTLGITNGASFSLVTSHPWREDSAQTDGDYEL